MAGATPVVLELWYQMLQARVQPGTVCLRSYTLSAFRCGDTGHTQDARSRYFGHLLTLPPKQASAEACIFLNMHGELGPPGGRWPPGLSPVELCTTLMHRNGHQGHSGLQEPPHARGNAPQNPPHQIAMHAQAHHVQLQSTGQQMHGMPPPHQMQELPLQAQVMSRNQAQLRMQAHAQGYVQARAQAQQIGQQAERFASLHGMQLPSGQLI